jgi:hypothetical protein
MIIELFVWLPQLSTEAMKQVGGVTAGVKEINCLSTSNMFFLSSIHAIFLPHRPS